MIDSLMYSIPWPLQGIAALAVVVLISWWVSSYAKAKHKELIDHNHTIPPIHSYYKDLGKK